MGDTNVGVSGQLGKGVTLVRGVERVLDANHTEYRNGISTGVQPDTNGVYTTVVWKDGQPGRVVADSSITPQIEQMIANYSSGKVPLQVIDYTINDLWDNGRLDHSAPNANLSLSPMIRSFK